MMMGTYPEEATMSGQPTHPSSQHADRVTADDAICAVCQIPYWINPTFDHKGWTGHEWQPLTDAMIERAVLAHTKAEGFISPHDDAFVSMRAALEAAFTEPDSEEVTMDR